MSAPQAIEAAAEARRDASITFLRELIALQPKGEAEVQAHVADALRGLGCVVDSLRYAPTEVPMRHEFAAAAAMDKEERASVIARLPGSGGGRSLIFFAHPDGEPIAGLERWKHDPFAGEIEAGRLYGWGVSDDLSGVAIMVEALQALKEAGLRPAGDVLVTSTPSKRHARGVAAALHHGYGADAAVYVHPAESGQGMQEVKAICSGQLYFSITVAGREPETTEPGHTSFAHLAVSALDKAIVIKAALAALDAERGKRVHHARIAEVVGRSTNILISTMRCGTEGRYGRMPIECVMGGAVSFPPDEAMEAVQAEIAAAIAAAAAADPWLAAHPPKLEWLSGVTGAEVPAAHPLFAAVSASVHDVTGKAPFVNAMHTASDIRVPMTQKGIPTVGFGPLGGDLSQNGRHDEWVDVDDYIRAIKVAAGTIMGWCGAAAE